ncbi:deoxyhypusine synthase family protein [Candidatus Hecatella orcuttiae]|uniref:deoxyhypusine synthase family protein n=1 Tax=Candidatus Hecatella orcuttiae TaxID=1935119 RepID=UPI002867C2B1|nr:deoxyhypusine synthase family protein [Candidatus Hecatella orcuttiae]
MIKTAHEFCKDVVEPVKLRCGMTVNQLILEMGRSGSFGAGRLAKAVDIYEQMLRDDATIFFGFSGAMVPAGMKQIVIEMIKRDMVDVIVSTGANMVHDFVEAYGGRHFKGTCQTDDSKLYSEKIDRIYDVFIPDQYFVDCFDKPMLGICQEIYGEMMKNKNSPRLSISEFFKKVGMLMKPCEDSIIYAAYKADKPIYVPALNDSCFGLLWDRKYPSVKEVPKIQLDVMGDMENFFEMFRASKKTGALVLGGGVPKNFIFQAAFTTGKKLDYAIQITMDRPEPGGLSGATLEEAVSWGKVKSKASYVQVIGDTTICFPIMVAAVMERIFEK